jgi:hypothetical protein
MKAETEKALIVPAMGYPARDAIYASLAEMASESPRCVMVCLYEDESGYPVFHITDGTILNPAAFSCFMSSVHRAAEETMGERLARPSGVSQIRFVMVETERFTMFSRRIANCSSLLLVLRSPVECLGMPIELLDRYEPRLRELIAEPGTAH